MCLVQSFILLPILLIGKLDSSVFREVYKNCLNLEFLSLYI